jgi:hypothetical protein
MEAMKLPNGRTIVTTIALASIVLTGFAPKANAHPHDILAQCQLPDGSWVMCDQTVHDTLTGKHVKKPSRGKPGNLTTAPRAK